VVRPINLLVAAAVCVALTGLPAQSVFAAGDCQAPDINWGTCVDGNINGGGDGVDLSGGMNGPGTGSSGGDGATDAGSSGGNSSGGDLPLRPFDFIIVSPEISLSDVASFRAVPGVGHMEPNGWMVVGLDTNFYATGGQQVVEGQLLNLAARVRFTPIAWHWDYGDGATANASIPGGTWMQSGVAEFGATSTSHIYRAPGTYTITLTIDYRAEYQFSRAGWKSIPGSISLFANRLTAAAGSAKTLLMNHDCAAKPSGPGC